MLIENHISPYRHTLRFQYPRVIFLRVVCFLHNCQLISIYPLIYTQLQQR